VSAQPQPVTRQDVASRRRVARHPSMFLRMLIRAAVLRRGRALSALLAMVVAAAVATAMLNLYVDVQAKLRKEFRNYGANVVVVAKDGQALPADAMQTVQTVLSGRGLAVPFAYVVARTADGQSVVVAGTDLEKVRQLDRWWSVTSWPSMPGEALIGVRAMSVLSPQGKPFDLNFQGHAIHLKPAGTLQTGAAEDSRVYLSLTDFETWTGIQPSTMEIAATGSREEINALVANLGRALPAAEVRPVRQIMEAEARVLGKTRSTLLAAAVLIILTAALCVLSTLMGWVLDRRHDFAIMKALGASERLIGAFFAAEAAMLGAVGAVLGFAIGVGVAAWIGRANFHAPVVPRFSVLPFVLFGSVLVALIAAVAPISLLRRVQPAMILRGE
jgi:putative ABC transport system permease protein